ncbi:hypothetical protein [Streptomyces sp. NRRL S-1022]|uniref:hypothetical protein n=1 Tax=Streptomyces sp. NRRL S-1022 TaxID=1463880 RepID=UPI00068F81F5|nr:hypothetical protein [Streptomyces sp. NRRL S-1022]
MPLDRIRTCRRATAEQVDKLRVRLSRAEEFAATGAAGLEEPPSHRLNRRERRITRRGAAAVSRVPSRFRPAP